MTMYMTFSVVADPDNEPVVVEASLPQEEEKLKELMNEAGDGDIDSAIRVYDLIIESMPKLNYIVDLATLREANMLAELLQGMDEVEQSELEAFALFEKADAPTVDGEWLINYAHNLETCMSAPDIKNDRQLGEYIMGNDLRQDITELQDSIYRLLDPVKIGREWRVSEGGVYTKYGYSEQQCPKEYLLRPYQRYVKGFSPSAADRVKSLKLTDGQLRVIGDALRQWDGPVGMEGTVKTLLQQVRCCMERPSDSDNSAFHHDVNL